MNCARCDGRGSFSALRLEVVDQGAQRFKRLVPFSLPCPSCQGTEADKERIAQLEVAKAALEARVLELERLAFVPGLRRCAKCACSLVTTPINAITGQFGRDDSPKDCPNGCGPMWPVTERQAANESIDREDLLRLEVRGHEEVEATLGELLDQRYSETARLYMRRR